GVLKTTSGAWTLRIASRTASALQSMPATLMPVNGSNNARTTSTFSIGIPVQYFSAAVPRHRAGSIARGNTSLRVTDRGLPPLEGAWQFRHRRQESRSNYQQPVGPFRWTSQLARCEDS